MVERAVGGFVEFFGIDGFVRGTEAVSGGLGVGLIMVKLLQSEPLRPVAKRVKVAAGRRSEPGVGARQTRRSPTHSRHDITCRKTICKEFGALVRLQRFRSLNLIADSSATGPQ
jgi:hypothetical protein